ncbi:MAG: DUF2309 family protein [Candidatus Accumulibacter sp.]|nr:DUF2309 family protein [Accumulibacter sp.]
MHAVAPAGWREAEGGDPGEPSPEAAAVLWQDLLGRLGREWTLGALLAHLTGEDRREVLHAYYFSTVNNEHFGCGSKVMHNLAGLFGVMQGASSDLRTGLPLQMVEVHEPMRLLVIVEQTLEIVTAVYQRQPPLQELIGNGWILLAAKHPETATIHLFDPASGWQLWNADQPEPTPPLAEVERSIDWFSGHHEPLPPALLRRPVMAR